MLSVKVLSGDITMIPSSAIITAVNAGLAWFGGIDNAIYNSSGDVFHNQLAKLAPLRDGQLFLSKQPGQSYGQFESVLFVVDELQTPIYDLVLSALNEAEILHLTSVSLPLMRTGVMAGLVESKAEVISAFVKAMLDFSKRDPKYLTKINIVVYQDDASVDKLEKLLASV